MARLPPSLQRFLDLPPAERRIGPFALIEQLGRGGFAPVWRAREEYEGTEVRSAAVKLFALDGPDAAREPVIAEARALCRVEHPSVVRFYALSIDEARCVMGLAMEHVDGPSLRDRLTERGRLSVPEALAVGAALAAALAAVHRAGLVHRDVKPPNVIEAAGGFKLIDFGIAAADELAPRSRSSGKVRLRDLPSRLAGARMSSLDASMALDAGEGEATAPFMAVCGTVGYIDPAIVAGGLKATAASDLYALGATLFECLTGRLPAVDPGSGDLGGEVLDGRAPAPKLREVAPEMPEELAHLVDALLAPMRRDRPASAAEVGRVIERLRAASPEGAATPGKAGASRRAMVVATLAAALGGIAIYAQARRAPEIAPPRGDVPAIAPSPLVTSASSLPVASASSLPIASAAPSPPASAATAKVPALPARSLAVPPGRASSGAWLPAFSLRHEPGDEGLAWLAAAERCRDAGLALCTETQWTRACEIDPGVASIATWTASADGDRGFVARGGAACDDRRTAPAAEANRARAGVCCSRAVALRPRGEDQIDLAAPGKRLLAFEEASRQGGQVLGAQLADSLRFFTAAQKTRREVVSTSAATLGRAPDFWMLFDTCEIGFDAAVWTADCRKLVRQGGKIAYVLTRLEWSEPAGISALFDLKVMRAFSPP
jgi:serine/threonine protein kinase